MTTVAQLIQQTWVNGFSSTMRITRVGTDGRIIGPYSSTTGASGTYIAVGAIDVNMAVPAAEAPGVPISVAIYWKALDTYRHKRNQSWNWVSAMSGQLMMDKNNQPHLNFMHGLTASSSWIDPPAVDTVPGTYQGQLHFVPYVPIGEHEEPAAEKLPDLPDGSACNVATASWTCNQDPSISMVLSAPDQYGVVWGTYTNSLGAYELQGVIDIDAASQGLNLQSISLSTLVQDPESNSVAALTLSGDIDLSTNVMSTTVMTSRSKDQSNIFYQTAVSSLTFS